MHRSLPSRELPELFRGRREFESIRLDLLAIQGDQRCATDAAALTEQFERLETNGLENTLRGRLRKDVSVCLCTPTDYQYDPRAATINRLMLRLLSKLGAYRHISVPCEQRGKPLAPSRDDSGERYLPAAATDRPFDAEVFWRVAWLDEVFDRVLIRGGPKWAVQESFPRIWKATGKLQKTWEGLRLGDATRRLRWAPDRFEPESPRPSDRFMEAATPYGVCAQGVKVVKEISSDGRRRVCHPRSRPDEPLVSVSGLFTFAKPLLKAKPVSFGLRIHQLNTDALSRWDFDAMYGKGEKNIDGAPLLVETFFRHVWFPVETLTVSITLPDEAPLSIGEGSVPAREDGCQPSPKSNRRGAADRCCL